MFTYRGGLRLPSICSQDPNKNKIQRLADVSGTQGVVEGSLGLADKPLFGDWTIVVKLQVLVSCTVCMLYISNTGIIWKITIWTLGAIQSK